MLTSVHPHFSSSSRHYLVAVRQGPVRGSRGRVPARPDACSPPTATSSRCGPAPAQARAGDSATSSSCRSCGEDEVCRRQAMSVRRRLRRGRFEEQATLEGFDSAADPKLPATQIRDLGAVRCCTSARRSSTSRSASAKATSPRPSATSPSGTARRSRDSRRSVPAGSRLAAARPAARPAASTLHQPIRRAAQRCPCAAPARRGQRPSCIVPSRRLMQSGVASS
jgi:hypothetical protein